MAEYVVLYSEGEGWPWHIEGSYTMLTKAAEAVRGYVEDGHRARVVMPVDVDEQYTPAEYADRSWDNRADMRGQ